MNIEERGNHSGKPFLSSELPPQFVGTIIIGNNWGEGKRETATNKVLPVDGVLVGADFSVWSGRESEEVGSGLIRVILV